MTNDEKLKMYEMKDAKRKQQVKLYFAKRNIRFDVCKKFFEKNANAQEKQNLANTLANVKI